MLAAADFDLGGPWLTLTFDRAVDVAGFDGTQIVVDDGVLLGLRYDGGGGATMLGPASVRVSLAEIGNAVGANIVLDASAATGIVGADDGGTWAGAAGLVLPWP